MGQIEDAPDFVHTGNIGKITAIHANMYRNTPHDKPQWTRAILPNMTAENIIWKSFLGETPPCEFDANRYIQLAVLLGLLGWELLRKHVSPIGHLVQGDLQIPSKVTTVGGIYLWKDGREVLGRAADLRWLDLGPADPIDQAVQDLISSAEDWSVSSAAKEARASRRLRKRRGMHWRSCRKN
jgi:hypothetical protein